MKWANVVTEKANNLQFYKKSRVEINKHDVQIIANINFVTTRICSLYLRKRYVKSK